MQIISKYVGESEEKLRAVFEAARQKAPAIIFIDEIDAICPRREDASDELQKRVVASMLTLMDGALTDSAAAGSGDTASTASTASRVVVIGATNRPNALDPALRRPGRFDREVEIGIPNEKARLSILQTLLARASHALNDKQIAHLASVTHGFVGADLQALCKEAALIAIHRVKDTLPSLLTQPAAPAPAPAASAADSKESKSSGAESKSPEREPAQPAGAATSAAAGLSISFEDMTRALGMVKPSAMREIMIDVPKVKWEDIGGQQLIKQKLKEAVEWPLQVLRALTRCNLFHSARCLFNRILKRSFEWVFSRPKAFFSMVHL